MKDRICALAKFEADSKSPENNQYEPYLHRSL